MLASTMSDIASRLLKLLSILQSARAWSGPELAERLGVSARTVRRDIERLRDLGYPVQGTLGLAGGYRLVAGTAMPPLVLEDDEAVAIAVGLRTAAVHAVQGLEEVSLRALAKVEQVLPSRLRGRVRALGAATVPLLGEVAPTVDPDCLTVLAVAVANRERLRFGYRAGDGSESRRHVEPHRLVAAERRWYLVVDDEDRDAWRTFRVDRIREPRSTRGIAAQRTPPADDPAAYVLQQMHQLAPTYRATVTLGIAAEEALTRVHGVPGDVEPIDERSCRLHTHTDTLEWLAFRLALLDCEFAVHEPPELAAYVGALGGRLTRATGGSAARP
jgi:predicted DNA-binding transcriptional regulator YafY